VSWASVQLGELSLFGFWGEKRTPRRLNLEMHCVLHLLLLLPCAAWSPAHLQLPTQRYKKPFVEPIAAAQQQAAAASFNADATSPVSAMQQPADGQFDYWRAW
jgi:hypothetical protein